MKTSFTYPTTPTVKVIFNRDGVNYSATIPNPHNDDGLVVAMLPKKVGVSSVVRIEPVICYATGSREATAKAGRQVHQYTKD